MAPKNPGTGQIGKPDAKQVAGQVQQNNAKFLKFAPNVPLPALQATLATGNAGGANAIFTFSQVIPAIPVWATLFEFECDVTVQLTVPASGSFVVSPWAPYSFLSSQLLLAGSPPWTLMEHTPWALDWKSSKREFDPYYLGLGVNLGATIPNAQLNIIDQGPSPNLLPVAPGSTVTNSATNSVTYTHHWRWIDKIRLQRNINRANGEIPMGDPENRPTIKLVLNTLLGTQPQASPYVSGTSNVTATTSGTSTVNLVIWGHRLDVLPEGLKIPTPKVQMGLTVNAYNQSITTAGQIKQWLHQQSMLYTAIHHLCVNNQVAQESDYFSLWLTQEQRSSRWEYDAGQNTYQSYFSHFFNTYHRYPEIGWLLCDFERGNYPDIPAMDPYDAYMTPDFGYAQQFGITPTPNMTTATRIPSGTTLTNAYEQFYEVGMVNVPY